MAERRQDSPPPDDRILILKTDLTNEEAIKHEIYMIHVLGRKDLNTGILINLTDGGEGGDNPSPSTREKMSKWQKGVPKPPSVGAKVSIAMKSLPRPKWFHKDGVNRFFREEPPEGWIPGRIGLKNNWDRGNRKWWNNGEVEVWREECPSGEWREGRLKKERKLNRPSG